MIHHSQVMGHKSWDLAWKTLLIGSRRGMIVLCHHSDRIFGNPDFFVPVKMLRVLWSPQVWETIKKSDLKRPKKRAECCVTGWCLYDRSSFNRQLDFRSPEREHDFGVLRSRIFIRFCRITILTQNTDLLTLWPQDDVSQVTFRDNKHQNH